MELISHSGTSTTDYIKLIQSHIYPTLNVGIIAHVDHGKTTLTDNLLSGVNLMTKDNVGSCFLDFRHDEIERRITMKFSLVPCLYDVNIIKHLYSRFDPKFAYTGPEYLKINIIDSPGHIDFIHEVGYTANCVDAAVLVVDYIEGLQSQTVNVLKIALQRKSNIILFINKLDRPLFSLSVEPSEVYRLLKNLIDLVNDTMKSLLEEIYGEDEGYNIYNKVQFNPAKNNVIFGSSLQGWGFSMKYFSIMVSSTLGCNAREFCSRSFSNYGIKERKLINLDADSSDGITGKPIFVDILERIIKMSNAIKKLQEGKVSVEEFVLSPFVMKLGLDPKNIRKILSDTRTDYVKRIMSYWLPLNVTMYDILKNFNTNYEDRANFEFIKHCLFENKDVNDINCNTGFQVYAMFKNTVKEFTIEDKFYINYADGTNLMIHPEIYYQLGNSLIKTEKVGLNDLFYVKSINELNNFSSKSSIFMCLETSSTKKLVNNITPYKSDPLYTNILNPKKIEDLLKVKNCLQLLKLIDDSFEYGVSDASGELYMNTLGLIHLDKLKYDLEHIYKTVHGQDLEYEVSLPRFKFKEYTIDSLDGSLDGENDRWLAIENKFEVINPLNLINSDGSKYLLYIKVFRLELDLVNKLIDKSPKLIFEEIYNYYKHLYEENGSFKKTYRFMKNLADAKFQNTHLGPDKAILNLLVFNNKPSYSYDGFEFSEVRDKVIMAFQQLCLHGPLAAETLLGVVFSIENLVIKSDSNISGTNVALDSVNETVSNSTMHTHDYVDNFAKFSRTSLTGALENSHIAILEAYCRAEALLGEKYMNTVYEVAARHKGHIEEMDWYSDLYYAMRVAVPLRDSLDFLETIKNRTSGKVIPLLNFADWRLVKGELRWKRNSEDYEEWGELEKHSEAMQVVKSILKSKNMKTKEVLVEDGTKQRTLTKNK